MGDRTEKRRVILEIMEYAVPENRREEAADLVEIYRDDRHALMLLHEFYSHLPEAREDWVRELRLVGRQRGIFLLAAVTAEGGYLYLVTPEGVEFQGSLREGYLDSELLDFFGFESPELFRQGCLTPQAYPLYELLQLDEDICPACHAATGEYHELGCPVEVCPWCGGQLVHCSCRYDQLGVDTLTSEEELERLEKLLAERGRIPYGPEQRPSFANDEPDILFE